MKPLNLFKPKPTISESDITSGLHWLTLEGTFSLGFNSITTSGFLAAFALALGANNLQIGILAAIPFLMQIVQIPAIGLVERIRRRKLIAVLSWFPAQLLWFPIALIPLFIGVPSATAITLLLWLMTARGLLNAVCNAAWNGWIRDLVPQTILGQFFSRRLAFATIAAAVFSLGASSFIDYWRGQAPTENVVLGYTWVLLFGALFMGLASPIFMSQMPEPLMQSISGTQPSLRQRISAPLRDRNFRQLIQFLFFWGFASNLAIPFFAVYMLNRLGLPLSWVISLSILSQLFNIFFLRVWGRLVDRFGNKAVLSVSSSLYLIVILGWIFTTMPERYFLTIPLLVILHVFAGIANAGVTLTVGTIGLKLAPRGEATPFLAGASLATNLGAGLGPLCGGLLADFFSKRQLNLTFTWIDPSGTVQLPALSIIGFDFLFGIAFILGVITLGTLATVREQGEVGREVILESLFFPTREMSRPMSSVPAYNLLANFPLGILKKVSIPGIDVALGVTAYQIAEMARAATVAAANGKRLTRKLAGALENGLSGIWKDKEKEEVKTHGQEIARQAARGAMHAAVDTPFVAEQLVLPVTSGVVEVTSHAGTDPLNSIAGASQGIIQGAVETGADLQTAVTQAIEAIKQAAAEADIPEEVAISKASESMLETAQAMGADIFKQVKEALPAKDREKETNNPEQRDQ
ncbi:MAG: MFS transporter [Dehalococcoidales bacterium]|nr:MFS transporter [Dehalococcoidales bacterium]